MKLLLQTQQRFNGESHKIFTEEINNIALTLKEDKRMQSNHSIEICTYGMSKDLVSEKEEINTNNITIWYKND